jgi:hypothetical protein
MEFPKKHSYNLLIRNVMKTDLHVSKASKIVCFNCPRGTQSMCGIAYRSS